MTVLRVQQVADRVGVSISTIWRWERNGSFPKRRRLGPNSVGWQESEVEAWLETRPPAAGGGEEAA